MSHVVKYWRFLVGVSVLIFVVSAFSLLQYFHEEHQERQLEKVQAEDAIKEINTEFSGKTSKGSDL